MRKGSILEYWSDIPEFERVLRHSLRHCDLPIVINYVNDILNFDSWLHGAIDPQLKNFSRQHNDWNPGMHSAKYDCSVETKVANNDSHHQVCSRRDAGNSKMSISNVQAAEFPDARI